MELRTSGNIYKIIVIMVIAISKCCGLRTPLYSSNTGYDDSYEAYGGLSRELNWMELAAQLGEESKTKTCVPVNVYALLRHGLRFPDEADVVTFQLFLSRLAASSINPDFEYLKNEPRDRFTVDKALQLVEEGFKEMSDIASRIKTRFPSLYENPSSLLFDSSFQTTYVDRTRDSAKGFISGFVEDCTFGEADEGAIETSCLTDNGDRVSTKIFWQPKEGDYLMEPQINCQKYKDLKAFVKLDDEGVYFSEGPEMREVQSNVETLLTGKDAFRVSVEEIVALQKVCGMESAIFGNSSWCDLFQSQDLRVMEYLRDLNEYWYSSYGYPINYEPSCVLLQNITAYLRLGIQKQSSTLKGLYKFAHSNTVQGLLALMDLYRPSIIPLADNYPVKEDWEYAASVIVPFASNIAFTLFQCADIDGRENVNEDDFKVLVTHNEQPIKVGSCESYFCPYTTLTSFLTSQAGPCDFDDICGSHHP